MALARSLALGCALAVAATTSAQTPTIVEAPHVLRVDGTRLLSGTFTYQTVLERDVNSTALGTRTVSSTRATYNNTPVWLLLESRSGDAIPGIDSLFAQLADLRPIHWGSTIGRARLSAEFRGDSAYGGTTAPAGRHSLVTGMPPGTIVSGPMLEAVLRLLPLQPAWEDSAAMLSVAVNGATVLPARISVIGEDQVRVPAGQFDCWVVSVRAGEASRGLYWVTKRDPIIVRSTLDVPGMGGAQYVSSLTNLAR